MEKDWEMEAKMDVQKTQQTPPHERLTERSSVILRMTAILLSLPKDQNNADKVLQHRM